MVISIITINLNNAGGLKRTIESVVSQSESNFEYIVIDGGSTDESLEIIGQHRNRINAFISEKDNGIYDAVNKGISKATGCFLIFLNSGDYFTDKNVISLWYDAINQFPLTDIFYGDTFFYSTGTEKRLHQHPPVVDLCFLKHQNLNHQSSLIRASLFECFGSYPLKYQLAADHWLYLKSMVSGKVFSHIAHPVVTYNADGLSHVNYELYKKETQDMWQELVPRYAQIMADQLLYYKNITGYKLVKFALSINSKLQKLK